MKFLKSLKSFKTLIIFIYLSSFIISLRSLDTHNATVIAPGPDNAVRKIFHEANHLLNRGYSYLADQSSLLERPASCLGKYDIFDYQIDIEKILEHHIKPGEVIFESKEKENKGQKILKEYTVEEIKLAQDFVIEGNYKVPNSNYLYQRGRSVRDMHYKKTVIYFHDKEEFSITLNNKIDFPKLSQAFLADSLLIFNKPEVNLNLIDTQDEYLKDAFAFLHKYGTHYLKKTRWGSRTATITELKLKKEDMISSNKTAKTDTNIKSGSISMESSRNKVGDRFIDFDVSMEIGNCHVDTNKNELNDCARNVTKFGLIGYEVDHLYNLFNTAYITGKLVLPDQSIVTPDKIDNIHKNLKNLIESVESSLYARNSIITDFVVYNNLAIEDKNFIGCLENPKTKRFHELKTSLFSDEHKVGKLHPIFKLNSKDFVNYYDLAVINKKKHSTYMCAFKDFNLYLEDIFSPHLFNRKFINGFKFASNLTLLNDDKIKPEDCTNLWVGKASKHGNITENGKIVSNIGENKLNVEYLCLSTTSNFFDPELIVDVKIKSFNENKCAPFKFNEREYTCICEKDLTGLTKKGSKVKKYLCYATKKSSK